VPEELSELGKNKYLVKGLMLILDVYLVSPCILIFG